MSMKHRFSVCVVATVVVVLAGLANASSQDAQAPQPQTAQAPPASDECSENTAAEFHACAIEKAKTFEPARTPDGKPDMQGFWQSPFGGTQNIEEHARNAVAPAGKTLIVDPPDGLIPYQPWAAAQIKENAKKYVEPNAACFPSGAPRGFYTPGGFQIRQTPGYVVVLVRSGPHLSHHPHRRASASGREHPSLAGGSTWPLGGEYAGCRHRQSERQELDGPAGTIQYRRPARGRALHLRRRGHDALRGHNRRPERVHEGLDDGVSHEARQATRSHCVCRRGLLRGR